MLTEERVAELRRHVIEGRYRLFGQEVQRELDDPTLSASADNVRASLYRLAVRRALLNNDIPNAKEFLTKASVIEENEDSNVLAADIAFAEYDADHALSLLKYYGLPSNRTRAIYMMVSGKADEALRILEAISEGASKDAEFHRVLAILRMANGYYDGALSAINRALELDERILLVQQTAGMINLYASYPTAFLPKQLIMPVDPLPTELLNLDAQHLAMLDKAVQHFDRALAAVDDDDHCRTLQLWRLAALSPNPETRRAAGNAARALLELDPPVDEAVQYSATYALGVHAHWVDEAHSALDSKSERPAQRLMLGWLCLENGDSDEAISLLMEPSATETPADKFQRKLLLSRAFVEKDQLEEAESALEGETGEDVRRIRAFIAELKTSGQADKTAASLFSASRKAAREGNWDFVVTNADKLLSAFENRVAIQLVLHAYFNTKRFGEFLGLYEKTSQWTGLKKDASIRRAHSLALWHTNQRQVALAEVKKMFDESPTANAGHVLAYMLFDTGDLNGLASIVPRVAAASDLTPQYALEIAHALQSSHSHEAAIMWDRAMALGVPEDLAVQALGIAYRIGREQQTEPLVRQMQQLAAEKKGGVFQAGFEEVRQIIKQSRERAEDLFNRYRDGDIPVHMMADIENLPIFVSHYVEPSLNAVRDPRVWTPVYVRTGNRNLASTQVKGNTLVMDLTSLVVAHYLGILNMLISTAAKILVPAGTQSLLHRMYEQVSVSQPARPKYMDQLLRAINGRVINVISKQNIFEWAANGGGFVVTSIPRFNMQTGGIEELSDRGKAVALNLRRLVETLHQEQVLTSWQADRALAVFGSEGSAVPPTGPSPVRGAKVLFDAGHVELMQQAQLLRPLVTAGYEVFITSETRSYIESQVAEAARRVESATNLKSLMELFADGLMASKIETREVELEDTPGGIDVTTRSVAMVSELGASSDDVALIDDRFCNRPGRTGRGSPVISVADCLGGLNHDGDMGDDAYQRALHLIRASGLLFVPLTTAEILYNIRRAGIREGALVETNELRVIRKYLGAALRQPGLHLVPHGDYDERQFVRAADDALREALEALTGDATRTDYVVRVFEAAQVGAVRQMLDLDRFQDAMVVVESLVQRLLA